MKITKKEVIIVVALLILISIIIFTQKPILSPEDTGWENMACGLSACKDYEMLQIKECQEDELEVMEEPMLSPEIKEKSLSEPKIKEKVIEESQEDENIEETEPSTEEKISKKEETTSSRSTQNECILKRCVRIQECNSDPIVIYSNPQNNEENLPITYVNLNWVGEDQDEEPESLKYDIYLNDLENPILSDSEDTNYMLSNLDYLTTYQWKIISKDMFSAESESEIYQFTTEQEPNYPPAIEYMSPENNSLNISINPTLSWSGEDQNNDQLIYSVYLGNLSDLELISENQNTSNFQLNNLSYNEEYFWQIKISDELEEIMGPIWKFTTGNSPNFAPSILNLQPENNSQNLPISVAFSWEAEDIDNDELTYSFYLNDLENPITSNLINKLFIKDDLEYNKEYYWKVSVTDEHGEIIHSQIQKFSTKQEETSSSNKDDRFALFDIKVTLLEDYLQVHKGEEIISDIILYNMGTLKPVDAFIDCQIENMGGTMFDFFHETLAVYNQTEIQRPMIIPEDAEIGNYVYTCILTYENQIATSSDLFKVVEQIEPIEEQPKEQELPVDFIKFLLTLTAILTIIAGYSKFKKTKRR